MMLQEITSLAMRERLSELNAQRPDIETLGYILGPERMLEWLHSVGVSSDPLLRESSPPVPPQELRTIVAAPTEPVFLWSGLTDAGMCVSYVDKYFGPPYAHQKLKLLDFGCGCGRTTRFLQMVSRFDVNGTDVNESLVSWCQANLDRVTSGMNTPDPPLAYGDSSFDFIYSLSIFTHLSQKSTAVWIDELARVTADDGIVLLTTHGFPALDIICESEVHQGMFRVTPGESRDLRLRLAKERFIYLRYDADVIASANAGPEYGNSFTHESYIREFWAGQFFEVVEFVPGGLRGWQDVVVLRRKRRASLG